MDQAHAHFDKFSFERLDVYQAAMEGLRLVMTVTWPPEIGAQIRKAAVAVIANIAEGVGRGSVGDRRRVEQHARLRRCYLRCVYMLTAMSRG